jgi:Cu(I)/Ag(I) efflux system protein CusF
MKVENPKLKLLALTAGLLLAASHYLQAADGTPMNHAAHDMESKAVQGTGVVQSIDAAKDTVTLAHEAIPALNWPAMTMPFRMAADIEQDVKVGEKVTFELSGEGNAMTITKIEKADP